jgi:hypothetical protein
VLFLLLLRRAFAGLRVTRLVAERMHGPKHLWPLLAWGCSVSLAATCVSFISVSYFGQMYQFFMFSLATYPALASFRRPSRVINAPASRERARPQRARPATHTAETA